MTAKSLDSTNEQLSYHFGVMQRCTVETEKYGRLLLATPPDTRYPYVYPRDVRAAIILLRRIACSEAGYDMAKPAFDLIESTARFMKDACKATGGGNASAWKARTKAFTAKKTIWRTALRSSVIIY